MALPIVVVDAFTSEPFRGNPAAVCILDGAREASWMQQVAREMNLAETAFVHPRGDGLELRWFTPAVEIELCGHATLAAAHMLWESGRLPASAAASFQTRSGVLTAVRRGGWIELDFPATPEAPVDPPSGLLDALNVSPKYVGRSRFDYVVELESEDAVRGVQPDFRRLNAVGPRGVIVTSRSAAEDVDFVSRFFAPSAGIDEDPVTGSAHCCLAPFWSTRLRRKEFIAHQISARGGVLRVRLDGDRVKLGGQAVTVWRGELLA
jgi:predicted PhzF superfamily epimerase YddE/YHI9